MNTSVYIPDPLVEKLQKHLKYCPGNSKNGVIVSALEEYLAKQESNYGWSDRFKQWQGCPEFEIDRDLDNCSPP